VDGGDGDGAAAGVIAIAVVTEAAIVVRTVVPTLRAETAAAIATSARSGTAAIAAVALNNNIKTIVTGDATVTVVTTGTAGVSRHACRVRCPSPRS
jgi:hypothetical protein